MAREVAKSIKGRLTKISRYHRPSYLEMARINVCFVGYSEDDKPVMGGTNVLIKNPNTCLTCVLSGWILKDISKRKQYNLLHRACRAQVVILKFCPQDSRLIILERAEISICREIAHSQ